MSVPDSTQESDDQHGTATCLVIDALEQLGSQWRLIVLTDHQDGEKRFNEHRREYDDRGGRAWREVRHRSPFQVLYSSINPPCNTVSTWRELKVRLQLAGKRRRPLRNRNDGPGFTVDEDSDELGTHLTLSAWLEDDREEIKSRLPTFEIPPVETATG
jgi:hypothetical protein